MPESATEKERVRHTLIGRYLQDHSSKELIAGEESTQAIDTDSDGSFVSSSQRSSGDESESSNALDLLMAYLLQTSCAFKGSSEDTLREVSTDLCRLGLISECAKEFACSSPSTLREAFDSSFHSRLSRSRSFWNFDLNLIGNTPTSIMDSRFFTDFTEVSLLGQGGFGSVVLCKNNLDKRHYAMKRILLDKSSDANGKILREVTTLSKVQHKHVVRYYQAWTETDRGNYPVETLFNSNLSEMGSASNTNLSEADANLEQAYLYIQMEYCPRTLRQEIDTANAFHDNDYRWTVFEQIVEGVAHIHSQGIIHRDLTPSNIFFDDQHNVKIGDFGLAKFKELEQASNDQRSANMAGDSFENQIGTSYYRAPEFKQHESRITEKADLFSLGVIFFEMWHHPFETGMERGLVLSSLRVDGPPTYWSEQNIEETQLLNRLILAVPTDRFSAADVMEHILPWRIRDVRLIDALRMIRKSEDDGVYNEVLSSIFDEDRFKIQNQSNSKEDRPSFKQYSELEVKARDDAIETIRMIFELHGARRLEISPYREFSDLKASKNAIKLLNSRGIMVELCCELRPTFISWITTEMIHSFRRYEISPVYKSSLHSIPNRVLQAEFDIVGETPLLTDAESIKVMIDIANSIFIHEDIRVYLNHRQSLEAIMSWAKIPIDLRQKIREVLCQIGLSPLRSVERETYWSLVRQKLLQDQALVDQLQLAESMFCGHVDQTLPRLLKTFSHGDDIPVAIRDLSAIINYLKVWKSQSQIYLDLFMLPSEKYYSDTFFQMYMHATSSESNLNATVLAYGGRYDQLIQQMWVDECESSPPGAVGVSFELEQIVLYCSLNSRPSSLQGTSVFVCSIGGVLEEGLVLAGDLWQANIKAQYIPSSEQDVHKHWKYAIENDVKVFVIVTEDGPQTCQLRDAVQH